MRKVKPMSQTDIRAICKSYGITDSVIVNEIIMVAKAFDGSIINQYREVVEYVKAVAEYC